jgi:hypothetical protein
MWRYRWAWLVFVALGSMLAPRAATADSAKRITLGSLAFHAQTHGAGIGVVRPSAFDAGAFPSYRRLFWKSWGAPTAFAQGWSVPDGPFTPERVQLRAYDPGPCDGALAYRRVNVRERLGRHWGSWGAYPLGSRGGVDGTFCLSEARANSTHHCPTLDLGASGGYTNIRITNGSCGEARQVLLATPFPPGWQHSSGPSGAGHPFGILRVWRGATTITCDPTD